MRRSSNNDDGNCLWILLLFLILLSVSDDVGNIGDRVSRLEGGTVSGCIYEGVTGTAHSVLERKIK